ncbi:MAG: NmrA family NAD(P)-binding protein [Gemmatimonadaceae bacterium]
MTDNNALILVTGATGELGGATARKLLAKGVRIRAMGRNRAKLDALAALGAETIQGDLLDLSAATRACEGATQIFNTANNVMGSGESSPHRVDVPAHRNLCAAARTNSVSRIVNVTLQNSGITRSPVDYFRIKLQVDAVIRESGVPFVLLAPTVFMETWAGLLIGDAIKDGKPAILFGDGTRRSNFIAVNDVAEYGVQILNRSDVQNETVNVGGPSTCSFSEIVTMVERALGVTANRKHIPIPALWVGKTLLRPFNEVASRKMSMGYMVATTDTLFDAWPESAKRFGVDAITMETFIERRFGKRGTPGGR